ncbi:MAG TPA: biopolymer transporter ExbD [Kiritimatiellia bacterium]|jgi:biopolymer transport protein ExbD|nr:biopolymer transporter ExbD [Kiritimatiellia bacterium]HOM59764.1 biopolymer transporter ExbD [Kiritimatiellia bacterium]HPK37992.1 biopolymer transporter ExbD [Kiritimatiellia bacterium]
MRLNSGYEDRKARLEMISLMDVMFLILVFFVYSIFSMAVHRGLKVELPAARGVPEQGERVIVTLAADGTLSLNRRPLALEDLVRGVTLLWRETGTPVLISTDRAAPLGVGIELLGRLKEGGVERVTFQVSGKP